METVDLPAVEILAAGVRIHGRLSPPDGDIYSRRDLEQIASANQDLSAELRPPAKIGHDNGLLPAVGELRNIRVAGDKLVADVVNVPRRFAELVKARAYHARSVELSRFTSQRTGRRYDLVVSGLAWLGGKLPAVRTLEDVVALYDDAGATRRRLYTTEEAVTDERETLIGNAIGEGRISEQDREQWERKFEESPLLARELLNALPQTIFNAEAIGGNAYEEHAVRSGFARPGEAVL